MKRARTGIIATAVLAVATLAFAQAKTDFSGSWAPEVDPAARGAPAGGGGGGGRGMGGGPMTVKQTATELTIERQGPNGRRSPGLQARRQREQDLDGSDGSHRDGEVGRHRSWSSPPSPSAASRHRPGRSTGGVLTIDRTGGRGPSSTTYKKTDVRLAARQFQELAAVIQKGPGG